MSNESRVVPVEFLRGVSLGHYAMDELQDLASDLLAQPAAPVTTQEPVAWLYSDPDGFSKPITCTERVSEEDKGEWNESPLYAHADASELERLTEQYEELWSDFVMIDDENEKLRKGMKGDYDLDAWLDFIKERDTHVAPLLAEINRLKQCCEKEFASVEILSNEVASKSKEIRQLKIRVYELETLLRDLSICGRLTSLPLKLDFAKANSLNGLEGTYEWMREVHQRLDSVVSPSAEPNDKQNP